jgi:hypothetical protein
MSRDTDNSFFIDFSLSRFYQHLLKGIASFEELGNRVIKQIKTAHAFRRVEEIRELSRLLLNVPVKEYQLIAQYYLIWCDSQESVFHTEALDRIIEQTQTYKAQALSSRAAFEGNNDRLESAMYFYLEALKTSRTISDYISASLSIAILKGTEGFHSSALKDMENIIPLIHYVEPRLFFNFHNSLAIERWEAGSKEEARNLSRKVLTAPFAHAYPIWQETGRQLGVVNCKEPHSYVSLKALPEPTTELPAKVQKIKTTEPKSEIQASSVIPFPALKEAPQPQKPDRLSPQEWSGLNTSEKRELVLTAMRTGAFTQFDYDRFMVMVGLLDSGPAEKVLDLEDEETISDIAVMWAHQVEPEELAAVMSAIRDCEDRMRQRNILDRFIRIVFEETQECGLNEEAWRLRVERRLPDK